jgi:hypothetical protein
LFSIDRHIPKLNVAGSIPVSRSTQINRQTVVRFNPRTICATAKAAHSL